MSESESERHSQRERDREKETERERETEHQKERLREGGEKRRAQRALLGRALPMERPAMSSCDDCTQSAKTMRSITFHVCDSPQCNLESVSGQAGFDPMEWGRLCFCARCLVNNYRRPLPCEYTLGGRKAVIENQGSTKSFICPRCCGLPHPKGKKTKPVRFGRMPVEAQLVLVAGPGNVQAPAMQLDAAGLVRWARSLTPGRRSILCNQAKGLSKLVKQQETAQLRERQGAGTSSGGGSNQAPKPFLFTIEGDGIAGAVRNDAPVVAFEWTKLRIDALMEASKPNSNLFSSKAQHVSWQFFASSLYGERLPSQRPKDVRNAKCPLQGADDCLLRVSFTVPKCPADLSEYVEQRKATMQIAGRKRSTGGGRGGLTSTNKRDDPAAAQGRRVQTEQPLSTKDAPRISYCKLPRPALPARPPKGSAITAQFEEENVVRLDISAAVTDRRLSVEDEKYVMELCDDPDATVVIKGLTDSLNPVLWTWEYILARCGHVVWKKVRVFEKKHPDSEQWYERGWKTMSLQDYHEYLLRRQAGDPDALSSVWYWIDFPMKEYLPELYQVCSPKFSFALSHSSFNTN